MATFWPLVLDVLSWTCIVIGSGVLITGAVGMLRLPDVFARMHSAGMIDTLGAILLIVGMMLQAGLTLISVKLFLIIAFLLYTGPTATHALARAAIHGGVEPKLGEFGNAEEAAPEPTLDPEEDMAPSSEGGEPSKT